MNIFTASDVINFAIRVEEDGEAFYRKAAKAAKDGDIQALFNGLADAEVNHKKIFAGMLAQVETVEPAETYEGEFAAYLSDYIDGKVIFTKAAEEKFGADSGDAQAAIIFAQGREADSILYYHEMKRFVSPKYYEDIDKIIDEERKHFYQLAEMKKKYT